MAGGDMLFICDQEACGNIAPYSTVAALRNRNKGNLVVRGLAALAGVSVLAGIIGLFIWFIDVSKNLIYLSFAGILIPVFLDAAKREDMTCFECKQMQMIPAGSPRGQYLMRVKQNREK